VTTREIPRRASALPPPAFPNSPQLHCQAPERLLWRPSLAAQGERKPPERPRKAADKDEILAEGRRLLAGKRQLAAAAHGVATLGQKIRAAREAHGLTQADLATRSHVAQAYLSYLEQDKREPSLSIAARIARELEIPLDELASTLAQ
jgi:DNA-binding XRE family transcriptional regulator